MRLHSSFCFRLFCASFVCLLLVQGVAHGQQGTQADDVIRINSELVQTGVMVFDKQGRFVDNLPREQFELRVDGQAQPVSFFERVVAGSQREEKIFVEGARPSSANSPDTGNAVERGRTVIFFIDDLHLELDSLGRTRQTLNYFIDREMNPNDQVLIASTSGQIGFLQQFTDDKQVLRAAIGRLNHVPYSVRDSDLPPMTEFLALKIEHNDRDVVSYYVDELLKRYTTSKSKRFDPRAVEEMVKNRAHQIVVSAETVVTNTLGSLDNLMQTTARMGGRKLVFFISDGFYLDTQKSGSTAVDKLRRITDAAVRSGVVIYTIDARGLVSGQPDAANSKPFDPSGRLVRANVGEITLSQDGLHALAGDTGGRALRNTFIFDQWVTKALKETSNYYLLAWKPSDEQRGGKFKRIEISIAGRPDLTVRLPKGYLDSTNRALSARDNGKADKPAEANQSNAAIVAASATQNSTKSADAELRSAINSFAPLRSVPTQLNVSYLDAPNSGALLTASVQVSTARLSYGEDGRQPAAVDVAGVVLNDHGKSVNGFKTRLTVSPRSAGVAQGSVIYNYKAALPPGLYQVRTAARDEKSGSVGSAQQWIEIPDLTKKQLTLSSLLVGGQVIDKGARVDGAGGVPSDAGAGPQVQFSVDKRFNRSSHLSFWIFIYNAMRGGSSGQPDVTAQVQILRGQQAIVTASPRQLSTAGMNDLARIPYGGEFPLNGLAPGRYLLQVTVTDRLANASVVQRSFFDVE